MASGVLYFPYMRVPPAAWFTRALLYWDRVSAIIPSPYWDDAETIGPYTAQLIREGMLKPLAPDRHEIPDLAPAFWRVLEGDKDRHAASLRWGGDSASATRIHVSKLGLELADALESNGLARRDRGGSSWYEVELRTADLFMAFLAVVVGRVEDLSPITDRAPSLAVLEGEPTGLDSSLMRADRLQLGLIESILPAPAEPIPIDELRRFKEKHHDLLERLRRRIEASVLEVVGEEDGEVRTRRTDLVRDELETDLTDVVRELSRRRWPRLVFGALCGVGAAAIPVAIAASGGQLAPTLLAAPGFLAGVYSALETATSTTQALKSPIAYAALAHAKFGE